MPPDDTRSPSGPQAQGGSGDDGDDPLDGDGTGATPQAGTNGQAGAGGDDTPDYESLYRREQAERRRLARRLQESRQQSQSSGDAETRATEAERQLADTRTELHRERAFNRLIRVASDQGAIDPEAVATMLLATGDVDIDDQGRPVDAENAVKDLLRRKAYLKATPTPGAPIAPSRRADAGSGTRQGDAGGEPASADFNSAFRRAAAKSRAGG